MDGAAVIARAALRFAGPFTSAQSARRAGITAAFAGAVATVNDGLG